MSDHFNGIEETKVETVLDGEEAFTRSGTSRSVSPGSARGENVDPEYDAIRYSDLVQLHEGACRVLIRDRGFTKKRVCGSPAAFCTRLNHRTMSDARKAPPGYYVARVDFRGRVDGLADYP